MDLPVSYHTYSAGMITLVCQFILTCSLSFRSASRTLQVLQNYLAIAPDKVPGWHTGRLWIMRLGYYKLTREKEKAEDWVWIIDHSVQIGIEKCLLILGIRLSRLPENRALTYQDVEPIELLPVEKSNGEIVYEQLESTVKKTGVPCEIIGDYGSDIKAGIEKFCQVHQETCYIYDIKHKMATLLKRELESTEQWSRFTRWATECKNQVQQTPLAALAPPRQRTKARYMNTEYVLNWGLTMTSFLNQSNVEIEKRGYDVARIRKQFKPLLQFKSDLTYWECLVKMTDCTENLIRRCGLFEGAAKLLEERFYEEKVDLGDSKRLEFKQAIVDFVEQESEKSKEHNRLLGSSEIIESVYGKGKAIERDQSKSGFTGLVLSLGAVVAETTVEVVKKAMEKVSTADVQQWCQKNIRKSLQMKRIESFKDVPKLEQKQNQLLAA